MLRDERPALLMVTVWARKGGAERLIVQLLDGLADDFRAALAYVRPLPPGRRTLAWDGPEVGLREALFGAWDVIHSHLFLSGLLIRLRRMWDGGFRWVHTVHYHDYEDLRFGRLKRWIDHHFVFPNADALVAVSPEVRDRLKPRFPRVLHIDNAIPLPDPPGLGEADGGPAGEAARERGGREARGPVIGTVAMLRPEKGLDDLVRAAAALRERHPGLRVRVAGEGEERPRLEGLIRRLGLTGTVELVGFVQDLEPFYRSLDAYVQPSRSETFGLAALDALRFRLPTVATAAGYLPELLGHGDFGAVVDRDGDVPGALARALDRALRTPDDFRARAERGLRHWRRHLDPERMEASYRDLYRRVRLPGVCMIQPLVTHATGGLQRQLHLQTRELARRGHRVFLVQRRDDRLQDDGSLRERWSHVTVPRMPRLGGATGGEGIGARLRGAGFVAAAVWALFRIRRRVDVLHAHQLHSPTLAGAVAGRLLGLPLVSKVTAGGALGEAREVRRLPFTGLRKAALRAVDRVLVLSEPMGEELRALGADPERIRRVPNAVELPPEPPQHLAGVGGPFRLLFTGRLSREKSLDTLLDAGGILSRRGHRVVVELVGGPDPDRNVEPALRARARELTDAAEVDGRLEVRFRGHVDDVEDFYRSADAFVLPSSSEGMSNALLEALSFGLPCLASDIPANRAVIDDGRTGLLFRQGSPEALADRTEALIRSRRGDGALIRRLSGAARDEVRRSFSVDAVVDALEEVYREVTGP